MWAKLKVIAAKAGYHAITNWRWNLAIMVVLLASDVRGIFKDKGGLSWFSIVATLFSAFYWFKITRRSYKDEQLHKRLSEPCLVKMWVTGYAE